jgi:hypothetical protein
MDPICRRGSLLKWVVRRFSAYVASGVPVDPGTDRRWAKHSFPNHNPAKRKTEADETENMNPIQRAVETATAVETREERLQRTSLDVSTLCLEKPASKNTTVFPQFPPRCRQSVKDFLKQKEKENSSL